MRAAPTGKKQAAASRLERQTAAARRAATARERTLLAQQGAAGTRARGYQRKRLRAIQTRLAVVLRRRGEDESYIDATYARPLGLANRLDALAVVTSRHASIREWNWVLTLTLLLLDSAPALNKAMMSVGRKTLYEQVQDDEEQAVGAAAKAWREARTKAARVEAQEVIDQATLHRELWKPQLRALIEKIVLVRREVTERYVEQWSEDARADIARWLRRARGARQRAEGERLDEHLRASRVGPLR